MNRVKELKKLYAIAVARKDISISERLLEKIVVAEKKKPKILDACTFIISVDDGFTEYSHRIRISGSYSIGRVHETICAALGIDPVEGVIRERAEKTK